MPEVNGFDPGWPSWAELASPDVDTSKRFYCELFDWSVYTVTVSGFSDYDIFTLGDVQGPEVAGMQYLLDDTQPPSWSCYFRSDDLEATVEIVQKEGGQVLAPPIDIVDLGRMALCSDPEGAEFALWKPGNLKGRGVVDEPSTMCWVELACRDTDRARHFYQKVFGWEAVERDYYVPYTNFKVGKWSVGGMVAMDGTLWPPELEPHWIPYFWVADCDESIARAERLGAEILLAPTDIEPGRYAVLNDPTGARLALITPVKPDADMRMHL